MPELPEVETVARELRELILGKTIQNVEAVWYKTFENKSVIPLTGQIIKKVGRKGKYLSLELTRSALVIHLRMTGQLLFESRQNVNEDHIRAKINFTDNTSLLFKDTRKFGRIYHVDQLDDILYKIGIDAVDPNFDVELFKRLLKKSSINIKSFLLAQDRISGVGNIYADESLFRAGIHPGSISNRIPASKIKILYGHLMDILHTAIENMGSTISDYRDSYGNTGNNQKFFRVYQRNGEPCVNCNSPISKSRIAGRGTHFCAKCQKIYK